MRTFDRAFRSVLDRTLVRLARYVDARVHPVREPHDEVFDIVARRAAESSADYIEAHLDHAQLFPTREQVWDYALSEVTLDGLHAEFGVFQGHSINHIDEALRLDDLIEGPSTHAHVTDAMAGLVAAMVGGLL